ncbi:protein kinase [Actinotalea sp. M2MS4P-6]|uniref:serine/threonine-protein kinase n=1 Tax=Actinotalea sp. M2MS4P-6 TaxID=2983762 RepID=UPI0021E4AD20|nr:protein kinase [Actinotalea sp. M2MS4P-6]MCV2395617.1 protein kinase [Actinotalea sp. M2MS4P-6]
MSSRREASQPPVIPGFEYVRLLGMGGFADVFLYRQQMPRRPVAVKVLLAASLDDAARARFRAEADIMASLSHHPSIVTVYQADVAPDGRPYLVMEYCSRPGLAQRYRAERMGVAEVLRIGIRLASAVETAHRAGVLHRDIKPANVLVTDFGWPALTDFGIAATAGLAAGAMVGMSIPWSPPEMLTDEPGGDVRSDVYSLAATIYSLLARRSPFEVSDASNSAADLIARIERAPLARTGRGDVPDSLHGVLERAMSKDPDRRHHSALALARALQQVEAELMLPLTPLDLPEDLPVAPAAPGGGDGTAEADQQTRLRPVRTVSPEAEEQLATAGGPAASAQGASTATADAQGAPDAAVRPAVRPSDPVHTEEIVDVPESWRRHVAELEAARVPTQRRPRRTGRVVAAGLAGGLLVTAAVLAAAAALDPKAPGAAPTVTTSQTAAVPDSTVAAPTDIVGTVGDGKVTFTWTDPEPAAGHAFLWAERRIDADPVFERIETASAAVDYDGSGLVCIEVAVVAADGRASELVTGCAP